MFPMRYYRLFPFTDNLFDEVLGTDSLKRAKEFPLEIITGPNYYKVRAVVAGADSDKLQINVDDRTLTISADIKDTNQLEEDESVYVNEIQYGHYTRQVKFDYPLDGDNVKANLKDGILELYLPKAEPRTGKNIKINKKDK